MTSSDMTAEKVEEAIKTAGETQNSIAWKTGISQATLRRRMKRGGDFTVEELIRIADALDIEPVLLFPESIPGKNKQVA